MRGIWTALAVALLVIVGYGLVMANGGSAGDGLCMTVSPSTLVLDTYDAAVTVHTNIPIGLVVRDSLLLEGIAPVLTKADSRGELVAKFYSADVKAIVEPGRVTLTITGVLADGSDFAVSDTITVK